MINTSILKNAFNGANILSSILKIKLGKSIPLYCEWEITDRCNYNCYFCGTKNAVKLKDAKTDEIFDILFQLSDLGTKMLHFTGGEPTLRKDLPIIIKYAKKLNMIVSLTTNGSCSNEILSQLLLADVICVSLDGTKKIHDEIRGKKGAFDKACDSISYLSKHNKKVLVTTVFTENTKLKDLESLINMLNLLGKVNITIKNIGRNINDPILANSKNSDANCLSQDYLNKYFQAMDFLTKKYKKTVLKPEPLKTVLKAGGLDVYGCMAYQTSISIKADGKVSLPCNGLSLKLAGGNIKDIYYGKSSESLKNIQGKHVACKGCNIPCMVQASSLVKIKGLSSIIETYISNLI